MSAWSNLIASQDFKEKSEEDLYQLGLAYRNAGNIPMAIDCFLPLAEKGYPRAQHNLAMKYLDQNKGQEAYRWFKCASDQNFRPSTKNLGLMNLLDILLPEEMLSHITSFLNMKDLSSFRLVSRRAQRIADSQILHTDYLNSETHFARDFLSLFSKVVFEPEPQSIKVARYAIARDSSMEVYFRDSAHLRNIVEQTPLIKAAAKEKVYYVRDESVEDGKELILLQGGKLDQGYFIRIISDSPVKLKGELKLSCEMYLPKNSDFSGMKYHGKGISMGELNAYYKANQLAAVIDSYEDELFKIRTEDAYELLEDRVNSRRSYPESFPDISDLCSERFLLVSGSTVKVEQKDYIQATKPLIYIANSISKLKKLRKNLPEFGTSIGYINYQFSDPGVYCEGPLTLVKGFKISTDTHMSMCGSMVLPDYNITFNAKEGIWAFSVLIRANSIKMFSKTLHLGLLNRPVWTNIKPENMLEEK